jgi:hypothetical protein
MDTIKLARDLREQLLGVREALRVSIGVIAERDQEIDRLRSTTLHQRAQLRAAMSGRTISDELAEAEREALHDWQSAA